MAERDVEELQLETLEEFNRRQDDIHRSQVSMGDQLDQILSVLIPLSRTTSEMKGSLDAFIRSSTERAARQGQEIDSLRKGREDERQRIIRLERAVFRPEGG